MVKEFISQLAKVDCTRGSASIINTYFTHITTFRVTHIILHHKF